MPQFDWDWWDSLPYEEKQRREQQTEWRANSKGYQNIKQRIKDNEGEFNDDD
jgi:hypothetical protein